MDTMEQPSALDSAIETVRKAGYIITDAESIDDKLDRSWEHFVGLARQIEILLGKGARLPPRDFSYTLAYGVKLVVRAARGVEETAR